MKTELIKQKEWVYSLLKQNNDYILVVDFCNQITDFWISYKLELENISDDYLAQLAENINKNPDRYKEFEVPTPKDW